MTRAKLLSVYTAALAVVMAALFILSLSWPLGAATSTLTGAIADAQGNPVNGTLTMQLPRPAQYAATNTAVANTPVSYQVVNGAIQSGPPLYDVAGLQPANLYYIAKVYDSAGRFIMGGNYVVTGASFNLGSATPTTVTTSNISYVTPATTGSPNTFTATQTFSTVASSSTPLAASGFIRAANADQICFRNATNTSDLCITGASNFTSGLNFNGVNIGQNLVTGLTGSNLTLQAGLASVGAGGNSIYVEGSAGSTNTSGGTVNIEGASGNGTGNGGDVVVYGGVPGASGNYGNFALAGRTFANLGTPAIGNGALAYCTDCTAASNPCTGGGTGAFAKRLNGAWVCN